MSRGGIGCLVLFGAVFVVSILIGVSQREVTVPGPPPEETQPTHPAGISNPAKARKERDERDAAALKNEREKEERAYAASAAGKICAKHSGWEREACRAISQKKIFVGMTAEQVRTSWGKPYKINSTTFGRSEHEQWVMREYGSDLLYFEDDVLTTIQQSKSPK
jgi:hypothetical protein